MITKPVADFTLHNQKTMPPKGKKSKLSSDAKYLFVNEDANTVLSNTRDVELDRTKQSHVQRRQSAKKRDEVATATGGQVSTPYSSPSDVQGLDTLTLTSPQGLPGGLLTNYFSLFDLSTIGDDSLGSPHKSSLYGSLLFDQPQQQAFGTGSQPQSPLFATDRQAYTSTLSQPLHRRSNRSRAKDGPSTSRRRINAPSSIALFSPPTNQVDSFTNTFLALERWAPPLIQYYTTIVIPHLFATELRTVPMQLMRHTPALHADMQTCMAEAAHMYALLAAVSARMLNYEGQLLLPDVNTDEYQQVPLFFKTKAITSLRQKLERGQFDRMVAQDIYRLMTTAVMMGDKPAADAHFEAMMEMVQGLGGLERFDDYIKERMILIDIWRASWTLSKPKLHLSWDPGHLPQEFRAEIQAAEYNFALGAGFDRKETSRVFSADFLRLVSALTEVADLTRYSFMNPLASSDFQWLLLRRTAIEHRILSSLAATFNAENIIAGSTKLAALIWIGMVLADRNKQLLSHQAKSLRSKLESSDLSGLELSHKELLLWISSTGALATIDYEDKTWFTDLARKVARKLEIKNIEVMEERLHRLLYVAEIQRDALTNLVKGFGDDERGKGTASEPG